MKNWTLNIVVFICAYLIFMVANLPATIVVNHVSLPPQVKLGKASGTVWQGKLDAIQNNNEVISDVKWQLSPMSLLTAKLAGYISFGKARDVNAVSGNGNVSTNFAFDHFSANNFTLRYPAADLVRKMNLSLPTEIDGRMMLKLTEYEQGEPYCSRVTGTLEWRKASMTGMAGNINLGQLDGDLGCQTGELELKVSKPNPLGLQVTALVGANNKFSIKGFVKPNGDMPDEVHNAMQFLGDPDSQGRFPLDF